MRGPLWWWQRRRHRRRLRPVEAIEADAREAVARLASTTDRLCGALELARHLPAPTEHAMTGDSSVSPR